MAAFALGLALFFRDHGLRRTDTAPSIRAAVEAHESMATPSGGAQPHAAAMNPPPAIATPPEPEQSEPRSVLDAAADVGNGEGEDGKMPTARERGTERAARAR